MLIGGVGVGRQIVITSMELNGQLVVMGSDRCHSVRSLPISLQSYCILEGRKYSQVVRLVSVKVLSVNMLCGGWEGQKSALGTFRLTVPKIPNYFTVRRGAGQPGTQRQNSEKNIKDRIMGGWGEGMGWYYRAQEIS